MPSLFSQSGDSIRLLSPTPFDQAHVEEDLQRWADANPHFLNDGAPMLSLGTEIVTQHDHSIDNLFVDGNGCLVVAELKRGQTPKEVVAQALNYAAYVNQLKWADVAEIGRKYRGIDLDAAFRECFGWPLVKPDKVDHRLLIVAESFEPSVTDAALYLINTGVPLALLQFAYFEVEGSNLFEVRTVLGEIPDQTRAGAAGQAPGADEGYNNWLFSSVAKEVPDIAKRQGWTPRYRVNKQSLPMVAQGWPTAFGDCQLRLDTYKAGTLAFSLSARKHVTPGLQEFLEARRDDWREAFPAEFANLPYETVYANLTYNVPTPKLGDAKALADIVERTGKMAGAMVPLLTEYFEHRKAAATRPPHPSCKTPPKVP